jgi:hypothetical protein
MRRSICNRSLAASGCCSLTARFGGSRMASSKSYKRRLSPPSSREPRSHCGADAAALNVAIEPAARRLWMGTVRIGGVRKVGRIGGSTTAVARWQSSRLGVFIPLFEALPSDIVSGELFAGLLRSPVCGRYYCETTTSTHSKCSDSSLKSIRSSTPARARAASRIGTSCASLFPSRS